MAAYSTESIRNIGLFSHGGAGKTSLAEAMLFNAKVTSRLGRVEDGNTVADFDPDEAKRRMSVQLALAPCEWNKHKINVVDVPGYAEFLGEQKAAMRVVDAAIIVLDAVGGVEVGAEQAWAQADEASLAARILFINKMDRENADFQRAVTQARELFGSSITPLQLPIGSQNDFRGVVDLLHMKAYIYNAHNGEGKWSEGAIPDDMTDVVATFREQLIERSCESDDDLMMKYLEGEQISDDEVVHGVLACIKEGGLVPIFCGSATCNIGVAQLMDAIVAYMPSPKDCGAIEVQTPSGSYQLAPDAGGPFAALVFKTQVDRFGTLSIFRVYSGAIKSNTTVGNGSRSKDEHIGQVYMLRGKEQIAVDSIGAGDFGAVAKMSDTHTGDTLCSPLYGIVIDRINFPAPVFAASITPRSKVDTDKLGPAITSLLAEDPTLQASKDPLTGETILSGMGESHVQIAAERMQRKSGVTVDVGLPRIAYRETIKRRVDHTMYRHKKQSGGHGQFAEVVIDVEPLNESDFEFGDRIVGGVVPRQYIPAVEKGVREALVEGVIAGYPVQNLRVLLVDGKFHPVDSSEMAFKIAASQAFKEATAQAQPILLEPVYHLYIRVPDRFGGDVMSDLNGKRGRVLGMTPQGDGTTMIEANAPLSEVQRYVSDLRSVTQGRGTFSMEFARYEEVPAHLTQGIVDQAHARGDAHNGHGGH